MSMNLYVVMIILLCGLIHCLKVAYKAYVGVLYTLSGSVTDWACSGQYCSESSAILRRQNVTISLIDYKFKDY
jgi:hypothetical protein